MYVCVCNALKEAEVRQALTLPLRAPDEVHEALGCTPKCGCCLEEIRQMMHDRHQQLVVVAAE